VKPCHEHVIYISTFFDLGTSEDDVDVDIKYCGYCHTDIHLINNDWGFTTFPCVGGHEVTTYIITYL
jgi:D-arabinose 1-dehydrogenase-like Zn-dependent alcohol dehydrogenase